MGALSVLLIAEGPSEFGELAGVGWVAPGRRPVEGYFPPMLRRLLGGDLTIEAKRLMSLGRYEKKKKLSGHADKAAMALAFAREFGHDLVVFVKDVDRESGAKKTNRERARKLASMHREIESGFLAVSDATHVKRIKATPCRMVEAWALGDAKAVAAVGGARAQASEVPSAPETIWGNDADPRSNHPKCVLRRALGCNATAETLAELAEHTDIDTLRRSCPESFELFFTETNAAALVFAELSAPPRAKKSRRGTKT